LADWISAAVALVAAEDLAEDFAAPGVEVVGVIALLEVGALAGVAPSLFPFAEDIEFGVAIGVALELEVAMELSELAFLLLWLLVYVVEVVASAAGVLPPAAAGVGAADSPVADFLLL